jgi:hypothetical protein
MKNLDNLFGDGSEYKRIVYIKQCPDPLRWYRNLVGRWWEVESDEGIEYKCREPEGYINFILKEDCDVYWIEKRG